MKFFKNTITIVILFATGIMNARMASSGKSPETQPQPMPTRTTATVQPNQPARQQQPTIQTPVQKPTYNEILTTLRNNQPTNSDLPTLQTIKTETERQINTITSPLPKPSQPNQPASTIDPSIMNGMKTYAIQLVTKTYLIPLGRTDQQFRDARMRNQDLFTETEITAQNKAIKNITNAIIDEVKSIEKDTTIKIISDAIINHHPDFPALKRNITNEKYQEIINSIKENIGIAWDNYLLGS